MLKRKAEKVLLEWLEGKDALLITGGRQVQRVVLFKQQKQGEVDFLIEYKGNVLPLEVKSGKDYKVHSALNNLLSNAEYDIPEAVVLCNGNVNKAGKVLYLPIYMVMLLKRTAPESTTIKLDLSTLVI